MLRVIGWTIAGAVIGAVVFLLGTLTFVELIQPWLFPLQPGQGFNAIGFMLYIFGTPAAAVAGAAAGLAWSLVPRRGT